jgi:hypothetical protein
LWSEGKRVKLGFFKTEERSANKRRTIRLELLGFIMVFGHRRSLWFHYSLTLDCDFENYNFVLLSLDFLQIQYYDWIWVQV